MALKSMAQIAVRPRRAWLIATLAPALLATAGCSHHRRDSLRPVYGMPATAAPCTNCGSAAGSSTIVTEPPAGATPRALSSEPAIDVPPATSESTVPSLGSPAGSTRSSQRSALPERAPKAVIGNEPDLDMIPSQSIRPRAHKSRQLLYL